MSVPDYTCINFKLFRTHKSLETCLSIFFYGSLVCVLMGNGVCLSHLDSYSVEYAKENNLLSLVKIHVSK